MNIMEYHFKQLHFEAGDDKVEPKMPEIKEIDESNVTFCFLILFFHFKTFCQQ